MLRILTVGFIDSYSLTNTRSVSSPANVFIAPKNTEQTVLPYFVIGILTRGLESFQLYFV